MKPFVDDMIAQAVAGYLTRAFPGDDLRPLSGLPGTSLGDNAVTLVDMLDTLALTGRHRLFRRLARWVEANVDYSRSAAVVSVFETNIRLLGGLLSAHFMYERGVVPVVAAEHDYDGGLLRLAADLGERLLAAFDTPTGLPYGSFSPARGVPPNETTVSANVAAGTTLLEMAALTRATGDPRFLAASRRAAQAVYDLRGGGSALMGNHYDAATGQWTLLESSVGNAIDSTLEYALKGHVLTGEVGEWVRFEGLRAAARHHLDADGVYITAAANNPTRRHAKFESLATFYPGALALAGREREAARLAWASHAVLRRYGALPESCVVTELAACTQAYPLRPEHLESLYLLYRSTRDPAYLRMGREFALALHQRTRVVHGFAGLATVQLPPRHDSGFVDLTESFLLSETLKYLYLLFDEASPAHRARDPADASFVGWIFTTEAHLLPNTAEWWPPLRPAGHVRRRQPPLGAVAALGNTTAVAQRLSTAAALSATEERAELAAELAGRHHRRAVRIPSAYAHNASSAAFLSDLGRQSTYESANGEYTLDGWEADLLAATAAAAEERDGGSDGATQYQSQSPTTTVAAELSQAVAAAAAAEQQEGGSTVAASSAATLRWGAAERAEEVYEDVGAARRRVLDGMLAALRHRARVAEEREAPWQRSRAVRHGLFDRELGYPYFYYCRSSTPRHELDMLSAAFVPPYAMD